MERGIRTNVIYAAAPLIGLTGTVGLLQILETGLPDPVAFTKGVALAPSATVIGRASRFPRCGVWASCNGRWKTTRPNRPDRWNASLPQPEVMSGLLAAAQVGPRWNLVP